MKNTLFAISVAASLGALLFLIFLFGITSSSFAKIISFLIFSSLLGLNIYIPTISYPSATESGALASIGVRSSFGLIALFISGIAIYCCVSDSETVGLALNIIAVVFFIFSFGFGHITTIHAEQMSKAKAFTSDHSSWAEQLKIISTEARLLNLKSQIVNLSENARFLTRDLSHEKSKINTIIYEEISNLGDCINELTSEQATEILNNIKRNFELREIQIKSSRHQV